MRKYCATLLLLLLCTLHSKAQYEAPFTNYWAMQAHYNPAATGIHPELNITGAYSLQMAGFENAPAVMLLSADMPAIFLSPKHGIGLQFLNDAAGIFSSKKIALQYAYHHPLLGGRISAGVRAALLNQGTNPSKLDLIDSGDPAFPSKEETGNAFDLDIGLRYTYKTIWHAGISMAHALSPTITIGDEKIHQLHIKPSYTLIGGYTLPLKNKAYTLHTDAAVRTDLKAWRADITARMQYSGPKLQLYGGLSYSPTHSITPLLGTTFHGLKVGYAYEIYTTGIGALHGTHEIILGYQTKLNLHKKGKNKHQSVRIL